MMAMYSVDDVLAYMEIPLLEEDDMSEDEFDGYIDQEEESNEDTDSSDGDEELEEGDDRDDDGGTIPSFSGQGHCTLDMTNKSAIDFLPLLLTDDLLHTIVEQTNLFADQFIGAHELARQLRVHQSHRSPHDVEELRKFLVMVIIMGLLSYPSIEDTWVISWPFATTTFSSIISQDRFSLILKFLHLNDSTKYIPKGRPGHDPLFKLRPFFDPLIANFQAAYSLGREISVDESMIGFKGHLWFLQCLPKKPTKWGMKAFILTDSITAYTYNWRFYAGM